MKDPTSGFDHWVKGIARNVARSYIRDSGKRPDVQLDDEMSEEQAEAAMRLSSLIATRELLNMGLSMLNPKEREAIRLFGENDNSYAKVAKLLGEKPKTVTSRIDRGLKRLRSFLEDPESIPRRE